MCRPPVVETTFNHYSGVGQSGISVVRVHATTVADDLVRDGVVPLPCCRSAVASWPGAD